MKRLITGLAILSIVTVLGGCGGVRAVPPTEPPVGTPGSAETAHLSRIRIMGSTNGWAVGVKGLLLRTADGGHRWSVATPKGVTPDENSPVFALDANTAWVAASGEKSTVYRTTDVGKTWREVNVPLPKALQGRFVTTEPPLLFPDGRVVLPVWSIHSDDDQPAVAFLQSKAASGACGGVRGGTAVSVAAPRAAQEATPTSAR